MADALETVVFRLLRVDGKDARLLASVRALRRGDVDALVYRLDQERFRDLPGTAFAYWLSEGMRGQFKAHPPFQRDGSGRVATKGLATTADFRFLRVFTEIPAPQRGWVPFAKGGELSPYFSEIPLCVNWDDDGVELKGYLDQKIGRPNQWSRWINAISFYFRPGLSWPLRASYFAPYVLGAGAIFSVRGYALFSDTNADLAYLLGILGTRVFNYLFRALLGREGHPEFLVGILQQLPLPDAPPHLKQATINQALNIVSGYLWQARAQETSRFFVLPFLLQHDSGRLRERLDSSARTLREICDSISAAQRTLDEVAYGLFGVNTEDRARVTTELGTGIHGLPGPISGAGAAADLVSWMVGVVFGRFDVRLATGERPVPKLPDPFAALPASSPAMLPEDSQPPSYPVHVDADGILVDDHPHADDVVRRVRDVFRVLWGDQADEMEKQICALLGTKGLRDYFSKTGKGGFWDDHFRRYFKSRRRAPIYWPLHSPRGLYRVWIYAHRVTKDTLPKLLGPRYVHGALAGVRHAIEELRPAGQTKRELTKKQEGRLAELEELLVDLEEFRALIGAAVARTNDRGETVGYAPDLSDGVVLAAAPLHGLIPWPKARKRGGKTVSELQAYWEELEQGEYDWAHVAMLYWPTRVTEKCPKDKSLALAHDLDGEFFPGLRDKLRRQAESASDSDEEPEDEAGELDEEEDRE